MTIKHQSLLRKGRAAERRWRHAISETGVKTGEWASASAPNKATAKTALDTAVAEEEAAAEALELINEETDNYTLRQRWTWVAVTAVVAIVAIGVAIYGFNRPTARQEREHREFIEQMRKLETE